ncbi:hypothetical protein [Streptomyces sp. NBC_01483]|nr:hypothetical protein [Streptomyces sp. NBC_01483]
MSTTSREVKAAWMVTDTPGQRPLNARIIGRHAGAGGLQAA